ncbi:MAG: hypothetical protein K9N35_01825 [Candidatus Marinimicrobia bacterium]|nr:hypothetical protein [Candidatus Neomarinimicrobiota bacterium]
MIRSILLGLLLTLDLLLGYDTSFKADSLHGALGDIISFGWEIEHGKALEATIAEPDLEGSGIEMLSQSFQSIKTGTSVRFQTAVYDSVGIYHFPPVKVYLEGAAGRDSIVLAGPSIEIRSILTPSDTTFRDIKDLHRIRTGINLKVFLILLALLVVAYIIYLLLKRFRPRHRIKDEIKIIPPEEAHVIALRDLDVLQHSSYLKTGKYKQFHSDLIHILKQYYENRFMIDALENTSSELIEKMNSMTEFSDDLIALTSKILTTADLIKFARGTSSEIKSGQDLQNVVKIVQSTKIEMKPAEESDLGPQKPLKIYT